MGKANKNVALLATCQALLYVNNAVLSVVNALAGFALATEKELATLPVTSYFLGSTLAALPVSLFMKRYGRVAGFSAGAACAVAGATLCAFATMTGSFWLLCAGCVVLGAYFAAAQFYRFAATEVVPPERKSTAISLVLAGGIVGGFLGPEIAKITRNAVADHVYAGAYIALAFFALLAVAFQRGLDIPRLSMDEHKERGRPLAVIARQPVFVVAVLCGVVSYGVMNFLMTGTPLAMVACEHPFNDAAFVIQWHLVAMFLPSFVTGHLIRRIGLLKVMGTGAALLAGCIAIALSGISVAHFWFALVLLGVGWNFMYVGATTLLTEAHTPSERGKVQGINDTAIFATTVVSSLSAGALFTLQGWHRMNQLTLPFVALAALTLLWLGLLRKRAVPA